jgi:hypothetical protein
MEDRKYASFMANESIPAYRAVSVAASSSSLNNMRVELWDTSTVNPIGFALDNVSTDGAVMVQIGGIVRAQCLASVSAGGLLTLDTGTGYVKEHGLAAASIAVQIVGVALQNGSSFSVINILFSPNYIVNG